MDIEDEDEFFGELDEDSYPVTMMKMQRSGAIAMLMFHSLVNLEDKPEEIPNGTLMHTVKPILDRIQSLGDKEILELSIEELAPFYGAAQLTLRLIDTNYASDFLAMTMGIENTPANKKAIEEKREYLRWICQNYIDFCNNTYYDDPDFMVIREYCESQVKRD